MTQSSLFTLDPFPRAILFDHDGVLVASEPLHWEAWGKLLNELGIPYHESEIHALVGKTAPEILSTLLDQHRPGWTPQEFDVHALAVRKNDFYLQMVNDGLKPYPGVREGLAWLRSKGVKTAVVSNARRRELDASLTRLQFASYFDIIISRDDVSEFKPSPIPYLTAAAELEVDPSECIAIEDSPPGLEAALLAKIPTAAVTSNFPREYLETPVPGRPSLRPKWIFRTMTEFFETLRLN